MKLERAGYFIGLWAALAIGGCIVEVDFDPIGSDASVEGAWQIDGAVPSQASCDALGITNVRVRFYDGGLTVDPASLVFSCADGSFDTRPSAVLADGRYTMEMLGIDASGAVIAEGGRETFDTLVEGGHIQMTTVNFVPAAAVTRVATSWTIDGATPDATNCGDLGIATVGIDFMDGGAPSTVACESGALTVDITAGSYNVQVMAYDTAGAVVAMAMAESFSVNEGETFTLNSGAPVPFIGAGFNPAGSDAALDASWTLGTTTASTEACEVAGGTTMEFIFYETTDTTRAEGVTVAMAPCADGAFTSTGNILRAGSYLVSIVYRDAAMEQVGRADFGEVTIAATDTLDLTDSDVRLDTTTLSFNILWQPKGDVIANATDCTTAGVANMLWDLYVDGSPPTLAYSSETDMDACEASLTFSADSSEPVSVGPYILDVEASDGTDPKAWSTLSGAAVPAGMDCAATIAAEGDLIIAACTVPLGSG